MVNDFLFWAQIIETQQIRKRSKYISLLENHFWNLGFANMYIFPLLYTTRVIGNIIKSI